MSPEKCKISNTVFFDDLEGQKNIIEYREGTNKKILAFEDKERVLPILSVREPNPIP